jgi:hypothetical protein
MYFPIKNRYNARKLKEMIASFGQIQHATFFEEEKKWPNKTYDSLRFFRYRLVPLKSKA